MNTRSTKPLTKKAYAKKILYDPKLLELFQSAINPELLKEHNQTTKFKNALQLLRKVRALYNSKDPVEKGLAFPGLEVAKLGVADFMDVKPDELSDIGSSDLPSYTWFLEDEIIERFIKDEDII